MSSSGRTALVTGGNRGLGAAIARALDDAGHRVIITHTPGNEKVAAWLDAQDTKGCPTMRPRHASCCLRTLWHSKACAASIAGTAWVPNWWP